MTAQAYRELLEALYGALEGRSPTLYQWDPSDSWARCRVPLDWSGHLQCWFWVSGDASFRKNSIEHDCDLIFCVRWLIDDETNAQAILMAAALDAVQALLHADLPHGARIVTVDGWTVEPGASTHQDPGWLPIRLSFRLHFPIPRPL